MPTIDKTFERILIDLQNLRNTVESLRKDRDKQRKQADAMAHVIVELGVSHEELDRCGCEGCELVRHGMTEAGYLEAKPHTPEECDFRDYGECPECKKRYYVTEGREQSSFVDPEKFNGHYYPGSPDHTSDCAHDCGCWAGPSRSGGPVDPFGPCPKNQKGKDNA